MSQDGMKEWIDSANYEELLRKWRFAPAGDEIFQGEIGIYYSEAMAKKRTEAGYEAAATVSKRIGW